ncbi:M24 family metallopeptidase [Carnobacterium gallinarum]|uniref:M24 family metallopeptidase n=1 Tax=Carnobacterium gallinarum TaxID=2749 RepID=UPI00054E7740|nr:Xaa-Pro peptidase family protein [Carnobacterium gallinarum]
MKKQLVELQKWLNENQVDVAFINDPANIAYFTGYESDPHERILSLLVFPKANPFLFTPALEIADAQNSEWEFNVFGYLDNENPWTIIAEQIKQTTDACNNWAVEKEFLTLARFEALQTEFSTTDFTYDLTPVIQRQKLIKTPEEIATMIEAGKWADFAFDIGFKAIQEGVSEQAIVAEIEYQLKKKGIMQMSFDTLVLAGDNAASPHGNPSQRKIQKNELVLFDLGVVYNGYTSDATRTVAYGEASKESQKIYAVVLEAHEAALQAVKPGVTAGELDKIARDIITAAGYGPYFNHRLGHGLGSSVHEFPSIMEGNSLVIEEGMCFSIEPGVYVPGVAGVRIEDCLYVTKDGCEVFTHTPKTYTVIN